MSIFNAIISFITMFMVWERNGDLNDVLKSIHRVEKELKDMRWEIDQKSKGIVRTPSAPWDTGRGSE